MYCVFPKQAEKSQLELFLPAVVFIFSSDCDLQTQWPSLGNVPSFFVAGCWAGRGAVGVVGWCEERVGGVAGHSPGQASALRVIAPVPWERACSGLFVQCFPSFLLCNKTTTKGLDSTMCLDQKLPFEIPVSTFPTLAKAMKQQSMGTLKQRWEPVHCTDSGLQNCPRGPRKPLSINGNISFYCFAFHKQPNQLWPALAVFAGGCFPECCSELAWFVRHKPFQSGKAQLGWSALPPASPVCLHVISVGITLGDAAVPLHWDSCPPEATLEWVEQWHPSHSSMMIPLTCDRRPKRW